MEGDRMCPPAKPAGHVLTDVEWGSAGVLFTPAYWASQVHHWGDRLSNPTHRLTGSLKEEVVVCLLGGHGIRSEISLAAFKRLRRLELLSTSHVDAAEISEALGHPVVLPDGRRARYRFSRVKGQYLSELLRDWRDPPATLVGRRLRDWFLRYRGIGLKTASWIVRNWYGSDEVAIVDIHIWRAGLLAGFYSPSDCINRDYRSMEDRFLRFSHLVGARPSVLDAVIWSQMRFAGRLVHDALKRYYARLSSEVIDLEAGDERCPEVAVDMVTRAVPKKRRAMTSYFGRS